MYKLGITGGIASGKSTASNYLKKKYNAFVFNADRESKKHLKSSLGLQKKIVNIFGQNIIKNKKIDFMSLANIAFSNDINHKILNGIMWPEILFLIKNKYEEIKITNHKLFIVDAALIFEANFASFFDYTVLITASKKNRLDRAIKRKNISLENIQNRISLQMPESKKKELSNYIINNNFSLENLHKKLDELYLELLK